MSVVEWLGLRFELPRPWEIIRHGISPRKGSLAFADRRRQRLQVTWTSCVKRPDVARLLSDHRDRQRAIDTDAVFVTPTLPAGWRGLERRFGGSGSGSGDQAAGRVRAARYDDATDRLIEVVLALDPQDPADALLTEQVLDGLRVTGRAEDARRWRAFGIDAELPSGWRLQRTAVRPADVTLMFVPRATKRPAEPYRPWPRSVTLRRRAMAGVWFDGDWQALFRGDEPKAGLTFSPSVDADVRPGHAGATATWNVPGPRYQRLLSRHQIATSRAWRCPADDAVYQLTAVAPANDPPTLAGFRLACGGVSEGRCGGG
ncbi:MAG: hypothetical protein AAGL98_04250 [Planctomycetota bacterium]